jgi:hypothetical protein
MSPFFNNTFRETVYYHYNFPESFEMTALVEKHHPDIVLLEVVERELPEPFVTGIHPNWGKAGVSPAHTSTQSSNPIGDMDATKSLYSLISEKKLGDVYGVVEMRENGILIHPGESIATKVSFDVSGNEGVVRLAAFISTLPPNILDLKTSGTVGVELSVDGRSLGRQTVDCLANYEQSIDLKNVRTLSVVVDNADGAPWYDWLMLVVQ